MAELKDIQEAPAGSFLEYSDLVSAIDKDPHSPEVWNKVLELAEREKGTEKSRVGFYEHVPLGEMIETAERLREAQSLDDKYRILAEKCSTGELWYDIILGRTNNQSLDVLGEEIGNWKNKIGEKVRERKWRRGLDVGSGTGNSLLEIKKHAENFVGLDRLGFLLQVARSRPELAETKVVTGEALNLPFGNETFDLVMSNGLTYYLPKGELPKFVSEVARVLEPGGSYFEAFTFKEEGEILPRAEKEFLKSGKSVLACLMDRLITYRGKEIETEPSHFSILKSTFEKRGFTCFIIHCQEEGIPVLEFKKKYPEPVESLRRLYLTGETQPAQKIADRLIYGQETREVSSSGKYSRAGVIEDGLLPSGDQLIKNLELVRKVVKEQEIIDKNSGQEYLAVFIDPLVNLATSDLIDPKVGEVTRRVLLENLEELYEGKIRTNTLEAWNKEGLCRGLERCREKFGNKPGCDQIVRQIEKIISGIKKKEKPGF